MQQQLGRRVHRLATQHHCRGAQRLENLSDAFANTHGDHTTSRLLGRIDHDAGITLAGGGSVGIDQRLHVLELFEQIGDPNLVRPPHGDAGFDTCADVVAVDMTVPESVAADDDDGVTNVSPG